MIPKEDSWSLKKVQSPFSRSISGNRCGFKISQGPISFPPSYPLEASATSQINSYSLALTITLTPRFAKSDGATGKDERKENKINLALSISEGQGEGK